VTPYGKQPATAEQLDAAVAQLEAAGLPYPMDLAVRRDPVEGATHRALYLTMRDGVRIAVNVHVPPSARPVPTCLRSTRYWRSTVGSPAKEHLEELEVERWLREGFALVLVDARGTGASFGTWDRCWDDAQRDDLYEIVDWVVGQDWSDGTVGGYGTSYDGTTAHLLAATGHPAVRAVVPRFGLYDSYADTAAPGGVPLDHFLEHWAAINWALDGHPGRGTVELAMPLAGSVQPVEEDLLGKAQAEHVDNWDLWGDLSGDFGPEADLGNGTPRARLAELHANRVPMWLWSSWYDGSYAQAQLRQLADPDLDVRVTIGPFSHGASQTPLGDPLQPQLRNLPVADQVRDIAAFLRHRLTGEGSDPSPARLRYYRLGDGWRESDTWPPEDAVTTRHEIGAQAPWRVDPRASSGSAATRWHGLIGGAPVVYASPDDSTRLLLATFPAPQAISGTPVLHLELATEATDFALHAYLEAVLPDGSVLYLTEGVHRGAGTFALYPISVKLPSGSQVRVTLAGADYPLFRRITDNDVVLEVLSPSWIDLPEQTA
jgi:predicted acyl esterase